MGCDHGCAATSTGGGRGTPPPYGPDCMAADRRRDRRARGHLRGEFRHQVGYPGIGGAERPCPLTANLTFLPSNLTRLLSLPMKLVHRSSEARTHGSAAIGLAACSHTQASGKPD